MYPAFADLARVELTLYTDALVTTGLYRTRQHRITDILNLADQPFLVLEEVTVRELGTTTPPVRAAYAQVNLASVLFAVADVPVEPVAELRTPKHQERALVSVPPFTIAGTIHLMPSEHSIREALGELTGRFLPVTQAAYWSSRLGEPRREAVIVAVNHERTQILAQLTDDGDELPGDPVVADPADG
jgi:hypothetical protein